MAAGKQDEIVVKHWFPGETTATDGLGQATTIPTDEDSAEATARTAVNTRVTTLSTRIVASGVLPTGV